MLRMKPEFLSSVVMTWADMGAAPAMGLTADGFNFGADFCNEAAARNAPLVAGKDKGEAGLTVQPAVTVVAQWAPQVLCP